ncbi:chaperonin 10-like protein [Fimicolochytrium jonesii]|uniref:chaperonin 10-like protein n=1 Tax=Fimicolochytrium jonesii TaxID=1396493 RepID=UPI0022FDC556|nr:chaperonin 10-like protein [Fimicolochytrium jonesii]KAI8817026.1 chaperonin 10-like protein [Fimicolochytrium jonesii]
MALNALANLAEARMGDLPTSTPVSRDAKTRPGATMKALAWYGKHDLRLIDAPVPAISHPKDAIIRVTGTTVCGSDLHLLHGDIIQLVKGDILGHEYMGIVEEVGSEVKGIKVGDTVVAAFNIGCGECEYCKKGIFTECDTTNNSALMQAMYGHKLGGILGYGHFGGGFAGGQAEYVRQPFADVNLLPIPADVPAEKALYLSDVVGTAYHAVVCSGAKEGETVGIWGLGPIGLHVAQWLRKKTKVARIIAVDNVPERMEIAKTWGVESINFDVDTDVVAKIQELVPGGLDRSIDCAAFRYAKSMLHKVQRAIGLETDTPEIVNECIRATKKFGTVALIADYAATTNGFLIGAVMEKGISLIGCGQAPVQRYWKDLLRDIQSGLFDPTKIVTHRFPFEQIVDVYDRFDKKEAGIIKVFLQTKFSPPPTPGTPPLTDVKNVKLKDADFSGQTEKKV